MKQKLLDLALYINKLFPEKDHPFNNSKNWVFDLNYTDFEYKNTQKLLDMYWQFFDLWELTWKKILDIWCGWWWKSIYIAEKYNCFVTGIDLNLNFLNEANGFLSKKWLQNQVNFKSESALDTSFEDNSFDIVIMSDVIEHIPNTENLFEEVYRLLRSWWYILFDFAPYYHYFWHHIWDTIRIPWLHVITSESFRIDLYKKSLESKPDKDKRLDLRIWQNSSWKESFVYLNGITRKKFETIISKEIWRYSESKITYFMLKKLDFLSKVPILRELFIKHIVWVMKK